MEWSQEEPEMEEDGKLDRQIGGLGGGVRTALFPKSGGMAAGSHEGGLGVEMGVGRERERERERDGVRAIGRGNGEMEVRTGVWRWILGGGGGGGNGKSVGSEM